MLTKVIAKLKTGSIKNVVSDGSTPGLNPPYVVVTQGTDALGRGTAFTINTHYPPDYQIFLSDYVRGELTTLLEGFSATSRHGNLNTLQFDQFGDLPELFKGNSDGTISMERVFFMPDKW